MHKAHSGFQPTLTRLAALQTEGIFRVPGGEFASRAMFAAMAHIKTGDEINLKTETNVHTIR
jgi:hypothetical protein